MIILGLMTVVTVIAVLAPLIMTSPGADAPPCGYRTRLNISTAAGALENYKLDNYVYPSTEQGLEALLTKPTIEPIPENWRPDGYLLKLPLDSWGRKILYKSDALDYELVSLGEDGKIGGVDCDKDITD